MPKKKIVRLTRTQIMAAMIAVGQLDAKDTEANGRYITSLLKACNLKPKKKVGNQFYYDIRIG